MGSIRIFARVKLADNRIGPVGISKLSVQIDLRRQRTRTLCLLSLYFRLALNPLVRQGCELEKIVSASPGVPRLRSPVQKLERKLLGKRLGTHARACIHVAHGIIVERIRQRFRVFTQDTNAVVHKRRENLSGLFADDGYIYWFLTQVEMAMVIR